MQSKARVGDQVLHFVGIVGTGENNWDGHFLNGPQGSPFFLPDEFLDAAVKKLECALHSLHFEGGKFVVAIGVYLRIRIATGVLDHLYVRQQGLPLGVCILFENR